MEERSLIMTISLVASSQTQFNNPYEARISKAKTLLKFSYSELELATGGFSLVNSLADGDFGSVHRGVLSYDQAIAVMQLKLASSQGTISSVPSLKPLPKTARFWGMRIDNILVAHHFMPMMKNGMVQSAQMSMELDMKKCFDGKTLIEIKSIGQIPIITWNLVSFQQRNAPNAYLNE
ncbi:hypothetical protein HPP92_005553 [Vanilla planifolia]|uniref:non-specific serine/threonine protein kinase n=1 Tax=Vanilla planifolia TaxID=51239 RepID=A0A835RH13_VANPL|nr:hypothetical protein HPP92_005553 [Vanilla planifolia]